MNDFNTAMFQNQPQEGSETLTDAQIADIAEQAGVPADVAAGIEDGTAVETFGDWVATASSLVNQDTSLHGERVRHADDHDQRRAVGRRLERPERAARGRHRRPGLTGTSSVSDPRRPCRYRRGLPTGARGRAGSLFARPAAPGTPP